MEYTRIYKRLSPKYETKAASEVSSANREEFALYQRAKAEYEKEYNETVQSRDQYQQIKQQLVPAHAAVSSKLGKEDYTKEELSALPAETDQMKIIKGCYCKSKTMWMKTFLRP